MILSHSFMILIHDIHSVKILRHSVMLFMADNLQRIRNQLIQGLATILSQLNVENLENDRLDSFQFRVDWIYGLIVRYQRLDVIDDRVVACKREARDCIHRSIICSGTLCRAGLTFNGEISRPRFEIPCAQLEFFVEKGFKVAAQTCLLQLVFNDLLGTAMFSLSVKQNNSCVHVSRLQNTTVRFRFLLLVAGANDADANCCLLLLEKLVKLSRAVYG